MVFTNVVNPRSEVVRKDEYKKTLVRRGASLGANATIVCGVTIGQYAFVGAGAVVTRDVADYALVVGNPARQTGWMCRCGIKLQVEGERTRCGVLRDGVPHARGRARPGLKGYTLPMGRLGMAAALALALCRAASQAGVEVTASGDRV